MFTLLQIYIMDLSSFKRHREGKSMGAAIAIAAIVGIAVAYFAAKEFELIAKDKGYADKKYF